MRGRVFISPRDFHDKTGADGSCFVLYERVPEPRSVDDVQRYRQRGEQRAQRDGGKVAGLRGADEQR